MSVPQPPTTSSPGRRRRKWRVLGRRALLVTAASFVILALLLLAVQVPGVGTQLVNLVLRRISTVPGATLGIGEVRGNWLTRIELRDLRMARGDTVLVAVDTVRVRFRPWTLLAGRVDVSALEIVGPAVASTLASGRPDTGDEPSLSVAEILRGRFYTGPKARVQRLDVRRGRYGTTANPDAPGPRIDDLTLAARGVEMGNTLAVVVDSLALRYVPADSGTDAVHLVLAVSVAEGRLDVSRLRLSGPTSAVTGQANWAPDTPDSTRALAIELHADPLVLSDFAWLAPGQGLAGDVTADVSLRGARLDRLSGRVEVSFAAGSLQDLHFGPTQIAADFADGRALIDAAITWEGARAGVHGWMRPLDSAPGYDLALQLDRLPARVPGAPVWEAVARRGTAATRLHISGRGYGDAALQVDGDVTSDAGRVELRGGLRLRPALEWEVQRLAIDNLDVARWAGDSTASSITGTFSGHGRGTKVDSLSATVAWDLAASGYGAWQILSAEGRASLAGRRLGGRLRLAAPAGTVSIDTLTALLRDEGDFEIPAMRFAGVDLAQLTSNPELPSDLSGTLRLEGRTASAADRAANVPIWRRLDATGRLALLPSRFRDRSVQGGNAKLRLHDGILDADLTMTTDAGHVRLLAEAHPFDVQPRFEVEEVRFADVDVGAWAKVPFSTRLSGILSGRASAGRAPGADDVDSDRVRSGVASGPFAAWSAKLRLEPSQVGSIAVTGGEAEADFSDGDLATRASFGTAAGAAEFRADAMLDGDRPGGAAHFVLPFGVLAALTGRDTLATSGDVRVEARFEGSDPKSAALDATVEGRGQVGAWSLHSLRAAVRLAGGALEVDTLALRSNIAAVDASGHLALSDSTRTAPSNLQLKLSSLDPSSLSTLLGGDTLVLAAGQIEAHLTGFPSAHAFTVRASLDSLTWNDLRLSGARAEAQGVLDDRWRPSRTTATFQMMRLRGTRSRLDGAEVRAALEHGALNLALTAQLDDAHHLSLVADAARDSSDLRIRLSEVALQAQEAHWSLVRPAQLRYGKGRLGLDSLEVRSDSALVLAYGTLDRHGQHDFVLRAEHVGLDILAVWLAQENLDGMLDGQVSVLGPAAAARVDGVLRIAATAAGAPVGAAEARLDWDGRQAQLQACLASPAGDSVTVIGSLPLKHSWFGAEAASGSRAMDDDLQLRAVARRFPLSALAPLLPPEALTDLQGRLDADLSLSGRVPNLVGEGHIGISDGVIGLRSLGVTYQDLQFGGVLSGDRFTLREGSVRSGEGDLQLTGDLRIAGPALIEPHLEVKFRDFSFVNTPDLRFLASGDLKLAGSTKALELSGQVTASDCTYFITKASMSGSHSAPEVVLTPADVRMLEETFGYQYEAGPPPMQDAFDAATLDLQVSLAHDNWVRKRNAPVLALAIAGDVRLRKPAHGKIDLRGRITPVAGRSYLEQFGRTFDFVGGEVLLNGASEDHTVDIRTEYKVRSPSGSGEPEVIVHMDVRGNMDKMRLVLTSEPPLSEAEIITYITTGRSPIKPTPETDSGSEAAALAAEIGLAQVTGALEHTVQEKVGLDVLQVRYDAMQGATLWAGRYVGPDLYIGVQQPLQYREEGIDSSQNPYQTVVDVEYEAYRWLILNFQGEASLIRSFIRARHAY